ncbi:helix-turn-helix domain-containing protein [Streptomyces afghaniensis]|uniref:helix-turn-helix domain-containing protein n=1 Tax=Streptomyces afghaniensis TaxID=66865 RepID=UPI002787696F|nr:helix-turn-helix transcriptional regulator [Streptomyces afghaniensis]MDQ1018829.1 transcriptional regulator with XRE-family HTH domain [Streptomyces afghaniensis]
MGHASAEIGALLRGARCAKRLTQAQVGAVCGYSASAVSRIESGRLSLGYSSLMRFAAFLEIPFDRLCASAVPDIVNVATVAGGCRSDEEDAVRRRELLTGVVAAGATAVVGAGAASAVTPPDDLELSLFRLPQAAPVPLPRLVSRIAVARRDFCATEYTRLGQALPGLIASAEATRDASAGRAREEASVALARAYVLAAELATKQHSDAAWVAADRALSAARSSGIPVAVGEASRVLAIAMRRSGRSTAAVHLLTKEAADLDANRDHTGAVRTTLLLTGAYSAAAGRDRSTALSLLEEAEQEADRRRAVPGLFTVEATRTQVDVYRIGVLNVLGTPDEAVKVTARLDVSHLPTPERRARAWTDVARMWHALGDGRQTFSALRQVEQEAPQEVRRPALRALTAGLLYGPAQVEGLRDFAARTGALTA